MIQSLPPRPSLEQLRKQAKSLLKSAKAGEPTSLAEFAEHHPAHQHDTPHAPKLSDAQLVVARRYGFLSWPRLKARVGFLNLEFAERVNYFVRAATANDSHDRFFHSAQNVLAVDAALAEAGFHSDLVLGKVAPVTAALAADPSLVGKQAGPRSWPPLLYVCYSKFHRTSPQHAEGLLQIAELLLDAGADPNASFTPESWPDANLGALYGTCGITNFPALAELLIERGADVNDGESLYHCQDHNDTRCMELLLAHGVSPNEGNALYRSFDLPGITHARLLLERGADANQRGWNGNTPLIRAIEKGRELALIRLLVDAGANVRGVARNDGLTPYRAALRFGSDGVVEYLSGLGATDDEAPFDRFMAACRRGARAEMRAVLEAAGPNLFSALTVHDRRALYELAEQGRAEVVDTMLAGGFPVDGLGTDGETALHTACWHGRRRCVEVLLAHGAPLEVAENRFGCTPIGWAAHGCDQRPDPDDDYPAIVAALIDAGADLSACNKWGEPLIALAGDNRAVADLLRARGAADISA